MKNLIRFFISVAFFSFCLTSTAYGQCDDKKMGIAVVRPADGKKPETPKAAQKFPANKDICKYICTNMQYPASLKEQNIGGVSTLEFVVKADGSVTDVAVVKSSGYKEFDDEAVRLIKDSPKWKPAQTECEDVDFKTQMDVRFDCEICGCGEK
ncbi:MAG: energy transducer TonB [Bacteroidales bacterium]|jgi:TonB family protein|nr:energy transducer TonB [Bacteroidales bacterium]